MTNRATPSGCAQAGESVYPPSSTAVIGVSAFPGTPGKPGCLRSTWLYRYFVSCIRSVSRDIHQELLFTFVGIIERLVSARGTVTFISQVRGENQCLECRKSSPIELSFSTRYVLNDTDKSLRAPRCPKGHTCGSGRCHSCHKLDEPKRPCPEWTGCGFHTVLSQIILFSEQALASLVLSSYRMLDLQSAMSNRQQDFRRMLYLVEMQ